jgi:hypothetical protein
VALDRALGQDQPLGDLPVGQRSGDQPGDLALPRGQGIGS